MNDKYLRSIIYGGVDGIITIFNIISGVTGAQLDTKIIIILGISSLFSDAVSMGMSDYLSLKANKKLDKDLDMDENTSSMITFISFIIFGLIPLLTFIILLKMNQKNIFIKSLFATMVSLFILGSYQSKITKENYIKLGLTTSFHGLLASIVSYNIGKMINSYLL
jgi:vacuolar iron transporter family protein